MKKSSSIIYDVLMPIGLPIVEAYHGARTNLIYNGVFDEAEGLEALGNLFLTPSLYVLGGKKVASYRENGEAITSLCFSYENQFFLKTLIAWNCLTTSQIVGGSCKWLSLHFSPETKKRHTPLQEKRALSIESHLLSYREKGIKDFYSEEFIPCQNQLRPKQISKRHQCEIKALKEITELFDEHGILYWIDCGTALGAYRYGGIIPWDNDIDLSIFSEDHTNVKRLLGTLDPKRFQIQDWSSYDRPGTFLKLYIKESKTLLDIYHYQIDEKEKTISFIFTYENTPMPNSWAKYELIMVHPISYEEIFPLKKAKFEDLTLWAPNQVEKFLRYTYGDNLDPTMVWDEESQNYKKVEDHPYWHVN